MPRVEKTSFPGAQGAPLAAILNWPEGPPRGFALLAHCFTCTKDSKATYWTGRTLAEEGIAVLRFDFSGLGESRGDFSASSFSSNIEDLLSAVDHLRARYEAPRLLVGHSLGGTAALATAGRIPEVRAVATVASPFDPAHLRRHLSTSGAAGAGEVILDVGGRPYRLGHQFLEDLERHDMGRAIRDLERALLILHSPVDAVVSVEQAALIFQAARHPKSFVALDGADHLLSDRAAARYAGRVIAAWSAPCWGEAGPTA